MMARAPKPLGAADLTTAGISTVRPASSTMVRVLLALDDAELACADALDALADALEAEDDAPDAEHALSASADAPKVPAAMIPTNCLLE